jgi:hypothetical protein
MSTPTIKLELNPGEFFRELINTATSNHHIAISTEMEFYLVNLLCEFISPAKLAISSGEIDVFDTPLALLVKTALEAPPTEQLKIYKVLGDTSLYLSGYFQDYCLRKTIDLDYFMSIGSHAYRNVSSLLKYQRSIGPQPAIYEELSDKFANLVTIVADVADQSGSTKASDILTLYGRWSQAPTERLRKLLMKNGVIPLAGGSKDKNMQ